MQPCTTTAPDDSTAVLHWHNLVLDQATRRVRQNDQALRLTTREFDVLQALMRSPGEVITREALDRQLYRWGTRVASNTVEVHVHHLRCKLGAEAIETVRGHGYRLAPP